jgi:hypothetical protein
MLTIQDSRAVLPRWPLRIASIGPERWGGWAACPWPWCRRGKERNAECANEGPDMRHRDKGQHSPGLGERTWLDGSWVAVLCRARSLLDNSRGPFLTTSLSPSSFDPPFPQSTAICFHRCRLLCALLAVLLSRPGLVAFTRSVYPSPSSLSLTPSLTSGSSPLLSFPSSTRSACCLSPCCCRCCPRSFVE